jgi:flagellar basal body-associated protein FliL
MGTFFLYGSMKNARNIMKRWADFYILFLIGIFFLVFAAACQEKESNPSESLNDTIPMGPIAVNLNKHRSHEKDRYLCLNMTLILQEMMWEHEVPAIHPKAREAAMIFLSSLVFDDVKVFTSIKKQNKKLVDILNPYMEGSIKGIKIEHAIVTTDIDRVEEFMIEHTLVEASPGEKGKEK